MNARKLIEAIRDGLPKSCDWCKQPTKPELLEPEEGGQWVCRTCIDKWEQKEQCHWHNGQPFVKQP